MIKVDARKEEIHNKIYSELSFERRYAIFNT